MDLLLFKAAEDESRRIRQGSALADIVNVEVRAMIGKENTHVVVCIKSDGYWYLRFKDAEFKDPAKLLDMVKRWENTRLLS